MLEATIDTLSDSEHPTVHSDRGYHYSWPNWIKMMDNTSMNNNSTVL